MPRARLRHLLRGQGYRRLLAVRLTSQYADGVFEATLASLFFFAPERATTPTGIAAAFAVLTVPFTLIGPWAGIPLDRWSRRNTLVLGNVVRGGLAALIATLLATHAADPWLYAAVLAFVSINRFLLAALSSGLPHVVVRDELVTANALTPTIGTGAYTLGAATAYVARLADTSNLRLLVGVTLILALAAGLGLRLGARSLGPDRERATALPAHPWVDLLADLGRGLRHLRATPTARNAMAALTGHRFIFGAATLAIIVIARGYLAPGTSTDSGLRVLGLVVGAITVGFVVAALTTPPWVHRRDPGRVIVLALAAGALVQATFAVALTLPILLAGAAVTGWAAQSLKICTDTIVQRDVVDGYRGRVFSVYDVLFNAAFVVAAGCTALVLPPDGYSRGLFAALAVIYLACAALYGRSLRR